MKILEAVYHTLKEAGEPLHYREITRRMLAQGIWGTDGKTPETAVNARLSADIKSRGPNSYFNRFGPGIFTLNNLNNHHAADEAPLLEPEDPEVATGGSRMKILEAISLVLIEAGEPLHYREITKRMLDQGLWGTDGKTPENAVNARLSADIKLQGSNSRFRRLSHGMIILNNHHDADEASDNEPEAELPNPPSTSAPLAFTEAAIQVLERFGHREPMHYRAIAQTALDLGLLATDGKTPEATMYAQIYAEIERQMRRGERPRFTKHGNGYFGLMQWMEDGLASKIEQHNAEIRRQLLKRIHSTKPVEFEELVGRLLTAMGFDTVAATPLSGDGGIDVRGRLVVGDVVRIRMAVQVKRWHKNVQAPVVQQVRGSLGAHEQGLIVTTSDFSKGARAEAERPDATPVALMNGEQLIHLLVEHNIGVRRATYDLIELGEDEEAE